jgi:hypothetical protein
MIHFWIQVYFNLSFFFFIFTEYFIEAFFPSAISFHKLCEHWSLFICILRTSSSATWHLDWWSTILIPDISYRVTVFRFICNNVVTTDILCLFFEELLLIHIFDLLRFNTYNWMYKYTCVFLCNIITCIQEVDFYAMF